ncbi:hypothetical protein Ddc_11826 [Ditylenchus destructor]|nr:hypothetical protein Ddc_11826 [Ditylenchus destructor]
MVQIITPLITDLSPCRSHLGHKPSIGATPSSFALCVDPHVSLCTLEQGRTPGGDLNDGCRLCERIMEQRRKGCAGAEEEDLLHFLHRLPAMRFSLVGE